MSSNNIKQRGSLPKGENQVLHVLNDLSKQEKVRLLSASKKAARALPSPEPIEAREVNQRLGRKNAYDEVLKQFDTTLLVLFGEKGLNWKEMETFFQKGFTLDGEHISIIVPSHQISRYIRTYHPDMMAKREEDKVKRRRKIKTSI